MTRRDSTRRFGDRVLDYIRGRPSYPSGLWSRICARHALDAGHIVADLGSGTGKLSSLFLEAGHSVLGVEPNAEMRAAAAAAFRGDPRFRSVDGTAESTGLPDGSVDVVAAGQAFHWFDARRAREESRRILRGPRLAVLVWNKRATAESSFLRDYEELLVRFGTDYAEVGHQRMDDGQAVRAFFGGGTCEVDRLAHEQLLDRAGLHARCFSSSYVPSRSLLSSRELSDGLDRLFDRHARDGVVSFPYETLAYHGIVG